jgi:hypothetical protein
MTSTSTASGSLDERKLEYDVSAKQRELDLKESKIAAREREVASKEKELERSRWLNPTVIGILVAGIGLISSLAVARLNNKATQDVERMRAQSTIILEAIRTGTGNTEASCTNLLFFADLELIDDPKQTIRKKCASVPAGAPSLPSAGEVAHFIKSAQLTPQVETTLKQTLSRFRGDYLSKFDIRPAIVPQVAVDDDKIRTLGCYHACENGSTIYFLTGYATPALAVHEFTHTVLMPKSPPGDLDKQWLYSAIEAGIANYLTADFLSSPVIDDFNLEGTPVSFSQIPHSWVGGQGEGGMAWGAFLWRLRGHAGGQTEAVTRAVLRAWSQVKPTANPDDYQKEFLQGLVNSGLDEAQVKSTYSSLEAH